MKLKSISGGGQPRENLNKVCNMKIMDVSLKEENLFLFLEEIQCWPNETRR